MSAYQSVGYNSGKGRSIKMDETNDKTEPVRSRPRRDQETPIVAVKQHEEDKSFKVVVTIVETYQDQERAMSAYSRFAGGHGHNHVVVKQGSKVLEEKDWGSVTDKRGYHTIDGQSETIFLDEHLHTS